MSPREGRLPPSRPGGAGRGPEVRARLDPSRFAGWDPTPEVLSLAVAPDPFGLQPGVLIAERFCVIGRVRHAVDSWRVAVTDVTRRAGAPPHHRLTLHRLVVSEPLTESRLAAVSRALAAHQQDLRRVVACSLQADGVVLVTSPAEGPALRLPLTDPEASAVVRTLSAVLKELHAADLCGLRTELRDLRLDGGGVQFTTWRHLLDLVPADDAGRAEDVAALLTALRGLGTRTTSALLDQVSGREPAATLDALLEASAPSTFTRDTPLPAEAPFVGRHSELSMLATLVEAARSGTPSCAWVSGPAHAGRTRLLRQSLVENQKEDRLSVLVTFRVGMPTTGLAVLLDAVAAAIQAVGVTEREQLTTRIRRAVGTQLAIVRQASAPLADLLGDVERRIVDIPLQERFLRHTGVLADLIAAIGTPDRVLALYLDDVHTADAGVRAVLWNLLSPGRRHHTSIVATVAALPAGDADLPLADLSPFVASGQRPTQLLLGPWSTVEVERWLAATLRVEDASNIAWALFHETGGLPGACWDTLRRWSDSGALKVGPDGSLTLASAAPTTEPPLPDLSDDALAVGAACAVRAEHVGPFWLSEVTGWSPPRVRAAVAELVQAGLIVQQPSGVLSWRDDRSRERFSDAAGPIRLQSAHSLIAQWLDTVDPRSTVMQRAWHLEHATAGGPSAELAALHLEAGHAQLEHGNVERAAWHFERVLDRTEDAPSRRRSRTGYASARLLQGDVDLAREAYLQAMTDASAAEAVDIAAEAVSAFYLRRSDASVLAVAGHALDRVGHTLPSGWPGAVLYSVLAVAAWGARWLVGRPVSDPLADRVALLHSLLVPTLVATHPWIALSSMLRAPAAAALRTTGESAQARAFLAPLLTTVSIPTALSVLATAERDAADHPTFLPVVHHMRGQTELSIGRYAEGQASMARAVEGFRLTGDLSIAVLSIATAAMAAIDREPTQALLQRLDHGLATAYRQRNLGAVPFLTAMRLWVRVRAGELSGAEVDHVLQHMTEGDPLQAVVVDALVAHILLREGRATDALARGRAALRARDELRAQLPVLDGTAIPVIHALLATGAVDEAAALLPDLERRVRRNPTLQVAASMCEARLAMHRGELERARGVLAGVVARASVHGEAWHVLGAHRWLAELLAGVDPAGVGHHRDLAIELARTLQDHTLATDARDAGAAAPQPTPQLPVGDDLAAVLESLHATLKPALPAGIPLELRCSAGLPVPEPRDVFELLVVNLVLAARDGAPRAMSLRLSASDSEPPPDSGGAGPFLRLVVEAVGSALQPPRGAVRECRDLAAGLGGVLSGDWHDRIDVYLPDRDASRAARSRSRPPGPPVHPMGVGAVQCADERLARTLVAGLVRLGWTAVTVAPGEPPAAEVQVILVDHDDPVEGAARVVRIRPRSAAPGPDVLRVPFVVDDLEGILRAGAATTAAAPQQR